MKQAILVTGGNGYIGKNIVYLLLKSGYFVISFDNYSNSKWNNFNSKNLIKINGDINNVDDLNLVFKKFKISSVIHCAGKISVKESFEMPIEYFETNVSGLINLIKVMNNNNVKKIIFSSTAATYGIPNKVPILETDKQNPINPYGKSKLIAERILKFAEKEYEIKSIIFRYFNVAGAGENDYLNYSPVSNFTHIIPVLNQKIKNGEIFEIFGNDYNTPDGTCIRDYVHVVDLAKAHILGMEYLENINKSEIFNISLDQGFSNKEIVEIAKKSLNKEVSFEFRKRRTGDPNQLIASNKKIKEILNWKPKYNLTDMIISDFKSRN